MTDYEKDIYLKIYDLTEENLKDSGQEMVSYKETFIASLEQKPSFVDLSVLNDVPRDKFIQALYYIVFGRWVINDEEQTIRGDVEETDKEFKIRMLSKVYNSTERMHAKRVVSNYLNYSLESNRRVGRLKRRFIKIYAGIKAIIPLSVKTKVKNTIFKIKAK